MSMGEMIMKSPSLPTWMYQPTLPPAFSALTQAVITYLAPPVMWMPRWRVAIHVGRAPSATTVLRHRAPECGFSVTHDAVC